MNSILTPRQTDVLQLAAQGQTYHQIGRALGITRNTVDVLMRQICKRLQAQNLPHAVLLGCRAGILDGKPRRHGDHAGYNAHKYRGEDPCDLCVAGERKYRAEQQRNRRKETAA